MNICRLYPQLKLTRTLTGRLATSGYPVLGMPHHSDEGRRIRSLVVAPPGYYIYEIDYSQIEMRTMAELSQDTELKDAYIRGEDVHAKTAHRVLGAPKEKDKQDEHKHRLPAKTANFGVLMGLEEKGLTEQVHKYGNLEWSAACAGCKHYAAPHDDDCDSLKFFREFFKVYPGVRQFQLDRRAHAETTGTAFGMWGMEWFLPGVWSPHDDIKQATLRQSHALPIQEGAQRLIKQAMAVVYGRDLTRATKAKMKVFPILQIHDSLVFLVEKKAVLDWHECAQHTMESIVTWSIPIKADGKYGPTWLELEKIK